MAHSMAVAFANGINQPWLTKTRLQNISISGQKHEPMSAFRRDARQPRESPLG